MRSPRGLVLATAAALAAGALSSPARASAVPDPFLEVDPLIGTADRWQQGDPLQGQPGATFPGATVPFGMVQVSPDTERGTSGYPLGASTGGYRYDHDAIRGFSLTHLSGAGCTRRRTFGDVPVLPTVGPVAPRLTAARPVTGPVAPEEVYSQAPTASFSHDSEVAEPGYYAVDLGTPGPVATGAGIRAELTATQRTAWQRYRFPAVPQANVLLDVGTNLVTGNPDAAGLTVTGPDTVEGFVASSNFCGRSSHTVWFTARFDRPFTGFGTWGPDGQPREGQPTSSGPRSGGWVSFDALADRDVVATIGVSFTSAAGARANLATEAAGRDFDEVRAAAADRWREMLGRATVEGGTPEQRRVFATAVYHALLAPNVVSDVDGGYPGPDGRPRPGRGHPVYSSFSLWDTYRSQAQLLRLLAPEQARDMLRSLVAMRTDGGWLPKWALAGQDSGNMSGDPVTPVLVDGIRSGLLRGRDAARAWEVLRENATTLPPEGSISRGREGLPSYDRLGYVPEDERRHGGSITLEYGVADCALSLVAADRGDEQLTQLLRRRAQSYRSLWDPSTGVMRPRNADGGFVTPFDPRTDDNAGFSQGTPLQYTWLVPQDPPGLASLMGGEQAAADRLDDLFAMDQLLGDPEGTAFSVWGDPDRYPPDNEYAMHVPYLYPWYGQPWKTQAVTRAALSLYTDTPDGIPGNEDLGAMSSWYVLSALGLYPAMAGDDTWVLTAPLFPRAQLAGTVIEAAGEGRFVQSMQVDRRRVDRAWLAGRELRPGTTLSFAMGDEPSDWGAATPPPTACPS